MEARPQGLVINVTLRIHGYQIPSSASFTLFPSQLLFSPRLAASFNGSTMLLEAMVGLVGAQQISSAAPPVVFSAQNALFQGPSQGKALLTPTGYRGNSSVQNGVELGLVQIPAHQLGLLLKSPLIDNSILLPAPAVLTGFSLIR